jgi:hypothetical protein
MSNHVIHVMGHWTFLEIHLSRERGGEGAGGVKYVLLGLRQQHRCLAKGKIAKVGGCPYFVTWVRVGRRITQGISLSVPSYSKQLMQKKRPFLC